MVNFILVLWLKHRFNIETIIMQDFKFPLNIIYMMHILLAYILKKKLKLIVEI